MDTTTSKVVMLTCFSPEHYRELNCWSTAVTKFCTDMICIDLLIRFKFKSIVSAARSLTCRDDLDSKWRLLLAENDLSRVSLLSSISIGN